MTTEGDLRDKPKTELQDMADELGLATSGTKDELADRIEAALAEDPDPEVVGEQALESGGPTVTPDEPRKVEPATLSEAGEPQPNPNTVDDGVEDIELGPPQVGQFVQITAGDYAGRFAAYLGDVSYEDADTSDPRVPPTPAVIQVRTRDADNLTIDVPYSDVSSTAYSGGR